MQARDTRPRDCSHRIRHVRKQRHVSASRAPPRNAFFSVPGDGGWFAGPLTRVLADRLRAVLSEHFTMQMCMWVVALLLSLSLASLSLASVAPAPSSCPSPPKGLECLSWWRWDTPEGCQLRDCCSDGIVSCRNRLLSPSLRRIHIVQGCHFDAGFVAPVFTILNRWFHDFFPLALRVGAELDAAATGPTSPRLRFTAQSWIVQLFLHCPAE